MSQVDRPTTLRIGPFDYEIIWEGEDWARSANCLAQIDNKLKTIRIQHVDTPGTLCAMLHEVIHAILFIFDTVQRGQIEEEQAANIGYGLVMFFRQNPHFWQWFVQEMEGLPK